MKEEPLQEEIRAVIERMMESGWVRQTAHGRGITASELTTDGKIAARLLQSFLVQGSRLSAQEMACFLAMIKTIPTETLED